MPRIRSIKPDFFLDADVAMLPPLCRLWYAGMWLQADKAGRLRDNPAELKVRILPYDSVDPEEFLERLSQPKIHSSRKRPFIQRYEHEGVRLIQILSFLEHQIINPYTEAKTPPLPAPPPTSTLPGTFEPDEDSSMPPATKPARKRPPTKRVTQDEIDRVNAMAQGWNASVAPMGVPRAANFDEAPKQSEKLAARLRANPWMFEKAAQIFEGVRRKYGEMIADGKASFLNFGWLGAGPLAKIEGLAGIGAEPKAPKKEKIKW